jgi:tartrate/fumarate subfamily iron-sulfur-dependent hydro-lyase beta chain
MSVHHLETPLLRKDVEPLKLGDLVYFSGSAFTCRSRLQKYIFDQGHSLPFSTSDRNLLIHVGPIVVRNGDWELVSFMPTSSIRFEKWGAHSVEEWGLGAIVGKTTMGETTASAMREHGCIHASPLCVSPNLWLEAIEITDVFLFDELGSIEAAWQLELTELGPFIVDIDTRGNNYFDQIDREVRANQSQAYAELGIPEDFEYTRLHQGGDANGTR